MPGNGNNVYYCNACQVKFSIIAHRRRKHHIFCPLCGECADVIPERERQDRPEKRAYKPWTVQEVELLRRLYKRGHSAPAIATRLERTVGSIYNRAYKLNMKFTEGE